MIIQYDGTRYDGWQRQGNTADTIQGKIEKTLERLTGESIEIHGSGRTDAGVHAFGQVANVMLTDKREPEKLRLELNHYLPEDIAILKIEKVAPRFHSRLSAKKKTYRYQIEMGEKRDVFVRKFQYAFGQPLNLVEMKKAAKLLCGTHDFKSFCGNKKMKKSTIRTIDEIMISQEGTVITLQFTGNGFLQNMVRILVGTLIEVGQGKRQALSMEKLIEQKNRQEAGFMAPAEGLCLVEVMYESVEGN